ncbi:solute carrier family 66 member 3 isoform X3 [Canis lupus baileyi]|uniref:solute carrier family 66 member 3 isoform X3 n=1 Tax=Canis lupus baileyi TaxID=143281 RepID=UPI003B972584
MREALLLFCNWSTLGVCAALKLPQISAVLAARSSRGISLPSLLLELAGFLVFLRYLCYYEYPLLTYLEYPILIAQDVLLLLCVFHFNGNVKGAAPYLALYMCGLVVRPFPAEVDHRPGHESEYFHQHGQQVRSAPVPVEDPGLGSRERPDLESRVIHLCGKNNHHLNDHQ